VELEDGVVLDCVCCFAFVFLPDTSGEKPTGGGEVTLLLDDLFPFPFGVLTLTNDEEEKADCLPWLFVRGGIGGELFSKMWLMFDLTSNETFLFFVDPNRSPVFKIDPVGEINRCLLASIASSSSSSSSPAAPVSISTPLRLDLEGESFAVVCSGGCFD